jgi:hypothetical protein
MPNYFKFTKKGELKPTLFADIDNELREHFGAPADPVKYYYQWYDVIGLGIAMGQSWDDLRTKICYDCPELLAIINYLEDHYTAEAWYQPH